MNICFELLQKATNAIIAEHELQQQQQQLGSSSNNAKESENEQEKEEKEDNFFKEAIMEINEEVRQWGKREQAMKAFKNFPH
jgi:hypothetical protein